MSQRTPFDDNSCRGTLAAVADQLATDNMSASSAHPTEGGVDDRVSGLGAEQATESFLATQGSCVSLAQMMKPVLDEIESTGSIDGALPGIRTGLAQLDRITGGLRPGQMVVIAAAPSVGKSMLALDWARSASINQGLATAVFSLELSRLEVTMRLLSAETLVPLSHLRRGELTEADWDRLGAEMDRISKAPMFIDDSPNRGIAEIEAESYRLKQVSDLRLVVIDCIQLMTPIETAERPRLEASNLSRRIKRMATELAVPIVVVSQLSRGSDQHSGDGSRPLDLRELGSLEQDADVIMVLTRPDAYDLDSDRPGEADLHIAKHRNGPTAVTNVVFQGHYSRFTDFARSR